MENQRNSEEIIEYFLQNGVRISHEKQEGSSTFFGRTVIMERDNCIIKIGYLNLNGKEIVVHQICCCDKTDGEWTSIPEICLI